MIPFSGCSRLLFSAASHKRHALHTLRDEFGTKY